MTSLKPATDKDSEPNLDPSRVGLLGVAKIIFSGLIMIGKKETWETNGIGAQISPAQIVAGAVIGALVLAVSLFLVVRMAIGFSTN